MKQVEMIRLVLAIAFITTVAMCTSSCSVVRETKKNVWTVDFQSPVKVKKLDKCN